MDCRNCLFFIFLGVSATIVLSQEDTAENNYFRPQVFSFNTQQETKNVKPRAYQTQQLVQNQVFGSESGRQRTAEAAPSQAQQIRKPFHFETEGLQNVAPNRPQKKLTNAQLKQLIEEEDELEKEEPDRLSELLQDSKFDCVGRSTGYYADEGLACEVFHYCQDNTKHSWICPDGFTFHQVHLICMPPSSDNICQKSSKYHFVNDYLYKPVNAEEAQTRPNVTLRYSDRYYPAEVYQDGRFDDDDSEEPEREQIHVAPPRRIPLRTNIHPSPQPTPITVRRPQVFRSPEEVDIPLIQRRPNLPQPFIPSNGPDFEYEK